MDRNASDKSVIRLEGQKPNANRGRHGNVLANVTEKYQGVSGLQHSWTKGLMCCCLLSWCQNAYQRLGAFLLTEGAPTDRRRNSSQGLHTCPRTKALALIGPLAHPDPSLCTEGWNKPIGQTSAIPSPGPEEASHSHVGHTVRQGSWRVLAALLSKEE